MALLRPFLAIFLPTTCISFTKQSSDGHFEVLNRSISYLAQKLCHKYKNNINEESAKKIMQMIVFLQNRKKPETKIFTFCVITFEPIMILTR